MSNLRIFFLSIFCVVGSISLAQDKPEGIPLYYWQHHRFTNFGDYLSLKVVERIVGDSVFVCDRMRTGGQGSKLLAIGSIFYAAAENDVIWGSGINGRDLTKKYFFQHLDVRAVRGPLSRRYLKEWFNIDAPEIYGDPGLLFPYLFPEFKKMETPLYDYIVIPHYSEIGLFPKMESDQIVYPTEPWDEVIRKILASRFVISSSLHGLVIAEAYGIPARMLRVTENEPLFKYQDYYEGTGRDQFQYATSIQEALLMGGEDPFICDLEKLYNSFPFEFWPTHTFMKPDFSLGGL